jgi:cyclomaltodextrinase / maltogenic alpha-amylase / neopullulanase
MRLNSIFSVSLRFVGMFVVMSASVFSSANAENSVDDRTKSVFERREADWRNGAIVYQVLVDRFAPPSNLEAKRHLYAAPKVLRRWDETPKRGTYLDAARLWSHEIEFWGGDLASALSRLDYLQGLGVNVLYLNPIHLAYTNHKYDAFDFNAVSPEFGTREDVKQLAAALKARGMKLVLDGVFNHMGRQGPKFKEAESSPSSRYRNWFVFGSQFPSGARAWWDAQNLPELNLENPELRNHIYGARDSVVRSYLRDGADGWRLDVAYDLGPQFLDELTRAAHAEKSGALVVGELPNYPREWLSSVDGVMNFTVMEIIHRVVNGRLPPNTAMRMLDRTVAESGIEPLLKSWIMLNNHDSPRLATIHPESAVRRLAQVLQFTLPGSPSLYYGDEVGMTGGGDPEMRAPMRWDLVQEDNPDLKWTKQLIALRKANRALRVGDYRPVTAQKLFAFERHTDKAAETIVVVANPTKTRVTESVLIGNSMLMGGWKLIDQFGGSKHEVLYGLAELTLEPGEVLVLKPELAFANGYSPYKRVR